MRKETRLLSFKQKQNGFTLVEVLVALAIMGFVVSAACAGILQIMTRSGLADNSLQAINNVQNAGEWISRDAANAETVTIDSGYPEFNWHEYGENDDEHKTTVKYEPSVDGSLMRKFTPPGGAQSTSLIAKSVVVSSQEPVDNSLNLTVTSTVGTGSQQSNETRTYHLIMRNWRP